MDKFENLIKFVKIWAKILIDRGSNLREAGVKKQLALIAVHGTLVLLTLKWMELAKNQYYSLRYIEIDPRVNPSVFRFFLVAKAQTFFLLFSTRPSAVLCYAVAVLCRAAPERNQLFN